MKFDSDVIELEFVAQLHPEARELMLAADKMLASRGQPELVITGLGRTKKRNKEIYLGQARDLARKFADNKLADSEKALAVQLAAMTQVEVEEWAAAKFSWHICFCAVDFRVHDYQPQVRVMLIAWLRARAPAGPWELLIHDVGLGEHGHLGRRDFTWRTNPKKQKEEV